MVAVHETSRYIEIVSKSRTYWKMGIALRIVLQLPTVNVVIKRRSSWYTFPNGHHTFRRTEKSWAGISSESAIEQVLMRRLKTAGEFARGLSFVVQGCKVGRLNEVRNRILDKMNGQILPRM